MSTQSLWSAPERTYTLPYTLDQQAGVVCLYEWGRADNPKVVFCVHGILQTAVVFDALAHYLASEYRVVVIDMPAHGHSPDLPAEVLHTYPGYLDLLKQVITQLGVPKIDYVGTSMGGVLAYLLLNDSESAPWLRRVVINDIAPMVPVSSVGYIHKVSDFLFAAHSSLSQAVHAFMSLPVVPYLDREEVRSYREHVWRSMFYPVAEEHGAAAERWCIRIQLRAISLLAPEGIVYGIETPGFYGSWSVCDLIRVPIYLFHGGLSTILPLDIAEEMVRRLPRYCTLHTIPDADHVPLLCTQEECLAIASFLGAPD